MISVGRIGGGHVVPVTYSYLGFPADTNGDADEPDTGSWGTYGSNLATYYKLFARVVDAADHGAGTAVAMRFRTGSSTITATTEFICLYNGDDDLLGYADTSSFSDTEAWSDYLTLTEAGTDTLDFASADDLYLCLCFKHLQSSDGCLAYHSADATSIYWRNTTDTDATPPDPPSGSYTESATDGLAVILKYIAD